MSEPVQEEIGVVLSAPVLANTCRVDEREPVTCIADNCRLVQYPTESGFCRKCYTALPSSKEKPEADRPSRIFLKDVISPKAMTIGERMAMGADIAAVAEALNTSPQTIKNQLGAIYKKLGITKGVKSVIFASRVLAETMEREMGPDGVSANEHHCGRMLSVILSPRQLSVAQYVAQGMTNGQIALKLSISEQTVKNYMREIMEKLGFSNRLEVALRVHHENFHTSRRIPG